MTVWELITSNSSLPIQAGTTFFDHLQNQSDGDAVTVTGGQVVSGKAQTIEHSSSLTQAVSRGKVAGIRGSGGSRGVRGSG